MNEAQAPSIDKVVSSAAKAVAQVRSALATLTDQRNKLDDERAATSRRIEALYALPVTREDALQCMLDSVDHVGAGFPSRVSWSHVFKRFAFPQRGYAPESAVRGPQERRRPLSLKDVEDAAVPGGGTQTVFSLGTDTVYTGRIVHWSSWDVDALYFFFGDLVKEKIRLHFDEMFPDYTDSPRWAPDRRLADKDCAGYIDATPEDLNTTVHERRAEIALLRMRLNDFEQQIEDTDTKIAELRGSLDV